MRLLGLINAKKHSQRFRAAISLAESCCGGVSGLTLAAATYLEGSLLPAEQFLNSLNATPSISITSALCALWAMGSRNQLRNPATPLLKNCSDGPKKLASCVINPFGCWLQAPMNLIGATAPAGHDNIEEKSIGTVLQSPCQLEVLGRLPARLLALYRPPQRPLQPQQATRGGRSPQPKNYQPHKSSEKLSVGTDVFTTTVAFHSTTGKDYRRAWPACGCCSPLDLPFRRDVLSRILNDQLERSGQDELPRSGCCYLRSPGSAHHSPATRQRRSAHAIAIPSIQADQRTS